MLNTTGVSLSLELRLNLLLVGLDSLHETQAGFLDLFEVVILVRLQLLVLVLQSLHLSLEGLLELRILVLLRSDLCIEIRVAHGDEAFDLRFLVGIAKIQIGRRAHWLEVLLRKFLQSRQTSATLVVLEVGRITILDGGVAPHSMLLTESLAFGGAVHIVNTGSL